MWLMICVLSPVDGCTCSPVDGCLLRRHFGRFSSMENRQGNIRYGKIDRETSFLRHSSPKKNAYASYIYLLRNLALQSQLHTSQPTPHVVWRETFSHKGLGNMNNDAQIALQSLSFDESDREQVLEIISSAIHSLGQQGVGRSVVNDVIEYFLQATKDKPFEENWLQQVIKIIESASNSIGKLHVEVCHRLAEIHANTHGNFKAAADCMNKAIACERSLSDIDRFAFMLQSVDYLLQAKLFAEADSLLSRASLLQPSTQSENSELITRFQLYNAMVFDSTGRFAEASTLYYKLANDDFCGSDKAQYLQRSVLCAILEPAGPRRQKVLSQLLTDDRSKDSNLHGILLKVANHSLFNVKDIHLLESFLDDHQKEASEIVTRAVVDHNVMSLSAIYENITLPQLAKLVNLTTEQALSYTSKMILQRRLEAEIDQAKGVIYFKAQELTGEGRVYSSMYDFFADVENLSSAVKKVQVVGN